MLQGVGTRSGILPQNNLTLIATGNPIVGFNTTGLGYWNTPLIDQFDVYGRCFGLAFQITDDLLDVEGHADQTGKRVQKDAVRGKLTYPGFLGITESRARAEQLCQEACGHVEALGPAGQRLAALVQSLVARDR